MITQRSKSLQHITLIFNFENRVIWRIILPLNSMFLTLPKSSHKNQSLDLLFSWGPSLKCNHNSNVLIWILEYQEWMSMNHFQEYSMRGLWWIEAKKVCRDYSFQTLKNLKLWVKSRNKKFKILRIWVLLRVQITPITDHHFLRIISSFWSRGKLQINKILCGIKVTIGRYIES